MEPLAHLDTIIFRNTLKVMLAVGLPFAGFLFWWIDRDFDKIQLSIHQANEQNQARIARLEDINLTPTNQILLTKVSEFLDAYNDSEKKKASHR